MKYYVLILNRREFHGPFDSAVDASNWGMNWVGYNPWRIVVELDTLKLDQQENLT